MTQQISASQSCTPSRSEVATLNGASGHFAPVWMQDARPSLLVIGKGEARFWTHAQEVRFLGTVAHEEAAERLTRLAHVDVILLDCASANADLELGHALHQFMRDTGTVLIVATRLETLDADFASLEHIEEFGHAVQWLCDGGPAEWAEALETALQHKSVSGVLHDSGQDRTAAQLQYLSEEVERLSRTLDALRYQNGSVVSKAGGLSVMSDADSIANAMDHAHPDGAVKLTAGAIRDLLRARRQRDHFLGADLFADPAWDMILDLMAARLAGERVSVSSLCIAAAVPPTTALRWIRHLTQRGLFERRPDTQDGRRVFIALSDKAAAAVHRWYTMNLLPRWESYE